MKLKLCGIRRIEDVEMINAARPDYVGFIFYPRSKRYIDPESARILGISLNDGISPVGVFVDESPETVALIAEKARLSAVQLHGSEDEDYIRRLRSLYSGEIWKAVRVREADDIRRAEDMSCDMLLLDAFSPDVYGGSGKRINMELLLSSAPCRPYFLAGGINAGNVAEIASRLRPHGLDISSGFESDGVKNRTMLMDFMENFQRKGRNHL